MAFYHGSGANGLAVIVDVRSEHCQTMNTVLDGWALGRRALGRGEWSRTLKVALREHKSAPWTAKDVKAASAEVYAQLAKRGINTVVPVQSPASPGVRQVHSAFNMFGHPGNPYKWAGTLEFKEGLWVAPILHPGNYEYVYGWLLERWLKQAWAVAQGKLRPMPWPDAFIEPGAPMQAILGQMIRAADPVAVDIETNMAGTIITAIGFSNQHGTISIPWDGFEIAGSYGEQEKSLLDYKTGGEIKKRAVDLLTSSIPKILHNGAFDVVQLAKSDIRLDGFIYDTLLMHRVVYPQYRHGLQQACATELCCEPWKSLFKPPKVAKDLDPWLGDPTALRAYNAKDSYATWQLWQFLERKLG